MFRGPSDGGARFGNRINQFISTNTESSGKMKAGLGHNTMVSWLSRPVAQIVLQVARVRKDGGEPMFLCRDLRIVVSYIQLLKLHHPSLLPLLMIQIVSQ